MVRNSRRYLLVDGYNIINAWEDLIRASKISLETAREKLIEAMANYSALTGIKVWVVFDAHMVERSRRGKYSAGNVDVIFTKEGETADQYIEKVVDAIGRECEVLVATSDWVEQQIVMGRGAFRISARELKLEVEKWADVQRKREEKQGKTRDTLGDIIDPGIKRLLEGDRRDKESKT